MKKAKKIFISILALLLVAGVAYVGITIYINKNKAPEPPTITAEFLQSQVSNVAKYATLEYRYTNVGKFEDNLDFYSWKLPFTTKRFIITYDGTMLLGVDTARATVQLNNSEIIIKLPPAEILSHTIEEDSIEVYDEAKNIFNPIKVADYASFATEQKKIMEERAIQSGMLNQAYDRAELQITSFISSLPGISEEYTITIKQDSSLTTRQPE